MPNASSPPLVEFLVSLGDQAKSTKFLKNRPAYIDAFPGLSDEEKRRLKNGDLAWVQQQVKSHVPGARLCVWII